MKKKKKSAKCRRVDSITFYDEKHFSEAKKAFKCQTVMPFTATPIRRRLYDKQEK
jgi:catabolite regulation protein CreA